MNNITRTAQSAYLQTCLITGAPVVIMPKTTLNEKLVINEALHITSVDRPTLKYVCIGNGGHRLSIGTGNIPLADVVQHLPTNAALYNQMPFVMRLPTNDLTAAERLNYRLRKIITVGTAPAVQYVAYYAKVLDLTAAIPQIDYNAESNGVINTSPYTSTVNDLNPVPPALNSAGVVTTTGDYVSAMARVPFIMNAQDVVEFTNVASILYGNPNTAIISEIALCSGIDKSVPGDFNGTTATYTDAIAVQVLNFINTLFMMTSNNTGINLLLELGASEPLLIAP